MASTLVDHLRSAFDASAVDELARVLGETSAPTHKAVDGLLPAITGGVINRASTDEGAATLYQLLKTTPFDSDPSMTQLADTGDHRRRAAESGNNLLGRLFTDRVNRLPEATAQYSGVSQASAGTLAGLVMSVLMGYLYKQVTTRNLTEPQLAAFLRGESDTVRQGVPAALAAPLAWLIGTAPTTTTTTTTTVRPVTTTTVNTGPPVQTRTEDRTEGTPWWRWLLYLLIPLLLLLLLLRACNREDDDNATTGAAATDSSTVSATDTVASDADGNAGAGAAPTDSANGPEVRVGVDLPGGRRLNVAENSFNFQLARFLATKGGQTPKVFTFDNLTFETNSARITSEARQNVDDLIQIMQAYPSLNIRIEGNTDSTGPEALNDPLSAERAQAVKQALVGAGIGAGRITTRELGEDKPVASNQTEAGRERNRRIDVVVTKL